MKRSIQFLCATFVILGLSGEAAAQKDSKKAPPKKGGKLDIKELEQKYWAPKDKDFSVVQNRTYSKKKRFSVSGLTGVNFDDTFNEGFNHALIGSYFFSERHGVEAHYIVGDLSDSEKVDDFENFSGGPTKPDFSRPTAHYGVSYTWVPFYAKMSLLGQKIIYFDMAISPGIGMTQYEQQVNKSKFSGETTQTSMAVTLDITQYFFISRHLAVRIDMRNRWYNEEVIAYDDTSGKVAGEKVQNKNVNLTQFIGGITYFF